MKRKNITFLFIGFLLLTIAFPSPSGVHAAKTGSESPKHEMRASWISTVTNIDLRAGMDESEYTQWAESTIKALERKNFNAVVF